jgi:hypothetical protein
VIIVLEGRTAMLKHALLIVTLGFFVTIANADTFDVTQISVSFEQFTGFPYPAALVTMSGPNASLLYTAVAMCNACVLPEQSFAPGTRFSPGGLPLNPDGPWTGELGGLVFDNSNSGGSGLALGIYTLGSFVFPQPSATPFTVCLPAVNDQTALELSGQTTSGTNVQNIVVNLPRNGRDCTTWAYGDYPYEGVGWGLVGGSFHTAPVVTPEPSTMALAGSGLLMLAMIKFRLLRRRT